MGHWDWHRLGLWIVRGSPTEYDCTGSRIRRTWPIHRSWIKPHTVQKNYSDSFSERRMWFLNSLPGSGGCKQTLRSCWRCRLARQASSSLCTLAGPRVSCWWSILWSMGWNCLKSLGGWGMNFRPPFLLRRHITASLVSTRSSSLIPYFVLMSQLKI